MKCCYRRNVTRYYFCQYFNFFFYCHNVGEEGEVCEVGEVGGVGKVGDVGEGGEVSEVGVVGEVGEVDEVGEVSEVGEVGEDLPESRQQSLLKVSSLTSVRSVVRSPDSVTDSLTNITSNETCDAKNT